MSRRKTGADQFIENVFEILRLAPWWVGPPVILLTWIGFRFFLPPILGALAGGDTGSTESSKLLLNWLTSFSVALSPFAAMAVAGLWGLALLRKLGDARRLDRQTGIESIRSLSWQAFEQLLAEAFRRQGYSVVETASGADGGVDLILSKPGEQVFVQAKQWKAWKVGVKPVRELFGVQTAKRASSAILVTSGNFTREARQFAAENGIRLVDGTELERLIADVKRTKQGLSVPAKEDPAAKGSAATSVPPVCTACGVPMVQRKATRGRHQGTSFWGCSRYPSCREIVPIE